MSTILAARAVAVLLSLSPVDRPREALPGWEETAEARRARYASIAEDVAEVAEASCKGNRAQAACELTAVHMLLGVAWHESGFAADVDAGKCYRGRDGTSQRCDGGLSHSMWQLRPRSCSSSSRPGAPACEEAELYDHDRKAAAKEALRRMWRSINACRAAGAPKERQLSIYAGGSCTSAVAQKRSLELFSLVARAERTPR